jgi:hypothetical protein
MWDKQYSLDIAGGEGNVWVKRRMFQSSLNTLFLNVFHIPCVP